MSNSNDNRAANDRRGLMKSMALGSAMIGTAAAGLFGDIDPKTRAIGMRQARAAGGRVGMAFIQWQLHTVPAASWSKGIEKVLKTQQVIDYKLLDGQNKVEGRSA
jgi:hypothetical protein